MSGRTTICAALAGLLGAWLVQCGQVARGDTAVRSLEAYSQGYCGTAPRGAEGVLPERYRGLELALVQVAVRHGDRAPLSQVPGTVVDPARHWSCRLDAATAAVAAEFHRYTVRPIGSARALVRDLAPQPDDQGDCLAGRLTGRGIDQQAALGRHLRAAYGARLGMDAWEDAATVQRRLYVRATAYVRTQQSAAALLWGALPVTALPIAIAFHPDDADEVMFGRQAACPRAVAAARRQGASAGVEPGLDEALEALFENRPGDLGIDPFVDAVYTSTCHDLPLPCGCGGCLDARTAAAVAGAGERSLCATYAGPAGGAEATGLALYPFLEEIAGRMRDATSDGLRLVVYSGHDTVIGPVLAALGAFDCAWPGYASRIAFELWTDRDAPPGADALVRVLYDGRPVTGRIPGCREGAGAGAGDPLCPLETFEAAVRAPLGASPSWEAACAVSFRH